MKIKVSKLRELTRKQLADIYALIEECGKGEASDKVQKELVKIHTHLNYLYEFWGMFEDESK